MVQHPGGGGEVESKHNAQDKDVAQPPAVGRGAVNGVGCGVWGVGCGGGWGAGAPGPAQRGAQADGVWGGRGVQGHTKATDRAGGGKSAGV
jgi:hypothetical protein